MKGLIVGIDNEIDTKLYRIIMFDNSDGTWKFSRQRVDERKLITTLLGGRITLLNAKVEHNRLVGLTGSLGRFNDGDTKPLVVMSVLVTEDNKILGYKVANYDGSVRNITKNELIKYCKRVDHNGGIPFQNGIYIRETDEKEAHIRCYAGGEYIKEVMKRKRSKNTKEAVVDTDRNNKSLDRLETLFNKEQIEELKKGKKNGVNIKVYGNTELSAPKMKVIREALEEGINAKLFADPEYSLEAMRILRADMKYGVDVSYYLNPKYSAEQLSELATGLISGVDVSEYADTKNSPEEMAEIRIRLENNIWKEYNVSKDKSWE